MFFKKSQNQSYTYALPDKYTVAFNRDRDFYQVPWALAEADRLETLVTDLYIPDAMRDAWLVRRLGLAHRTCPGIPSRRVRFSAKAVWLQMVRLRLAQDAEKRNLVFLALDAALSGIAGRTSLTKQSGLFLYSGYALEAFSQVSLKAHRKLLFVYHPQGDFVSKILIDDFAQHPEVSQSHRAHLNEIMTNEGARVQQEIEMADAVVCASTFTANSVRHSLGAVPKLIRVVPYGTAMEDARRESKPANGVKGMAKVLFVGQGTQRKGLHHLIKVWGRGFDHAAELTLVVNKMDPGIGKMIDGMSSKPRVLERLSKAELHAEYERADIFVLPSLVEGFGLVYLEALSAGCHVIGTSNTGLPDLEAPPEAVTVVQPAYLNGLYDALNTAIQSAAGGDFSRNAIREFATTRTWEKFRQGIRDFVDQAELVSNTN